MRATIDNSHQTGSEIAQLVIGWTVISAAVFLLIFNALVAIPVLFIGGCILGPYYSSRMSIESIDEQSIPRKAQQKIIATSEQRLEKALLYKELFDREIISRKEYEDTVGRLFPELERNVTGPIPDAPKN